jgi:prepilin-type N-terminal cleavage/methylation domain-containing protein
MRNRRAFTLIEILVVIGIIVILAAVLLPMVTRSRRQAQDIRTAADMQSIGTALEAFKQDHGDYPRTEPGSMNTGFAMLGRYLYGPLGDGAAPPAPPPTDPPTYDGAVEYLPGDVVLQGAATFVAMLPNTGVPTSTKTTWAQCANLTDMLDGPGIRMRVGGKKFGPYVAPEKMTMRGLAFTDNNSRPILYFPGRPGKVSNYAKPAVVTPATLTYVMRSSMTSPPDNKAVMKYDADDNLEFFRRGATEPDADVLRRIQAAVGDLDGDGWINSPETAAADAGYILWSPGRDEKYGPEIDASPTPPNTWDKGDWDKSDDIVSFRQ